MTREWYDIYQVRYKMSNVIRNTKIDFLRGIAILAVLILHFNISYGLDKSALANIFSASFIQAVASNGNYGVTIFFVISGFLITSTSLARYGSLKMIDAAGFYIYRASRIIPCLLLALCFISLLSCFNIPIFKNDAHTTSFSLAIFSVLTFWHNVLMEKVGYFNYCLNILWSLSVEEIFYLMFPIMCLLFKRTRYILFFWAVLLIVSPIYRTYHANNEIIALYGYLSCFDAIAMGCIAAVIAQTIRLNEMIRSVLLYVSGFLIAGVYLYDNIMANITLGPTVMACATAIYLICASGNAEASDSRGILSRTVCWFGKNSYELYLFHIIVLALMKEMIGPDVLGNYAKLLWFMLFMLLSAVISGLISSFYSQPMNRKLREVLFATRQQVTRSLAFSD